MLVCLLETFPPFVSEEFRAFLNEHLELIAELRIVPFHIHYEIPEQFSSLASELFREWLLQAILQFLNLLQQVDSQLKHMVDPSLTRKLLLQLQLLLANTKPQQVLLLNTHQRDLLENVI
jgi:hypothetical protein